MTYERELKIARELAEQAAERVRELYTMSDTTIKMKEEDGYVSPLTKADLAANEIIVTGLRAAFPEDAILTEEEVDDKQRLEKERVWIIDPLDGTKEFIKRNGEFTVNIALVETGVPVLGIVAVPAKKRTYYAAKGGGAYLEEKGEERKIAPSTKEESSEMILVVSRSHRTPADEAFSEAAGFQEMRPAGSSVKGCLVAAGEADVYFRSGPQHEWDICAMDAIIREAGAQMTDLTGTPITYNQEETLRHGFLVTNGTCHKELLGLL